MTKTTHILLILLLSAVIPATAQIKVQATTDTNNITIGDHVTLTISAENPGDGFVLFPAPDEIAQGNIEVIAQTQDTTVDDNGKVLKINQRSTITSFTEGVDTIGPLVVRVQSGHDTAMESLWTEPLLLAVNTVEVDTNQAIKDIEDVMRIPLTFKEILPWLLLALALAAIGVGVWFLVKYLKKRKNNVPEPAKPAIPPDTLALSQLEQLRVEGLWKQGRVKDYHTNLTDILRQYLYNQYDIDAAEMTSDQITDACAETPDISAEQNDNLRQILQTADLVKFAKAEPQPWEHDRSMSLSVDFVSNTADATKQRLLRMQQKQQEKTE
ncbi:MAG: hypothetical protein IK032_01425 [Bacteroidales bacterium]|nr:hypothetical protein [Bacteroidales bacterium]